MRSAPREAAVKGTFKKPWMASVWRRTGVSFRAAATASTGRRTPVSLFTSIMDTRAVSSRTAAKTASAATRPAPSGFTRVTSYPSGSRALRHWRTALCSTAVETMCFPTRRFCQRAERMAQLSPSVPQEVKRSCRGGAPRASATAARLSSTRSRAARPRGYWAEGLPKSSVRTLTMTSATWAGTGVVAA